MSKVKMTVSIDADAATLLETLTSERKRGEYLSSLVRQAHQPVVRQQAGPLTKEALIAMLQAYQEELAV